MSLFAFGGKSENKNLTATWNQPFPVHIPPFPTPPQSKNSSSTIITTTTTTPTSEKKLPGKTFSHLPPFPPARTYTKIQINDSKPSNETTAASPSTVSSSKKRKAENENEENSSSTMLREKKITATKNIQKTLTRLDSLINSETTLNTSALHEDSNQSKNNSFSTTSSLHQGPPLSILNSTTATTTTSSSASSLINPNRSSGRVVLDENCDFLKGLSKEEKLLMGVSVHSQVIEKEDGSTDGGNIPASGPGPKQHFHHSQANN